MQAINLQIPNGYEILEKTQTLKSNKALDLLLSGKQSEFSKAHQLQSETQHPDLKSW